MSNLCTCGEGAVHQHELDGSLIHLCPACNAVLYFIRHNNMSMDVVRALPLLLQDDWLERMSGMKPEKYVPSVKQATKASMPVADRNIEDLERDLGVDSESMFRTVPESSKYADKRPPVMEER